MANSVYIAFLRQVLHGRTWPLILIADHAAFHQLAPVRQFALAHRTQLRMFFFPNHSPELNPDEQVWNQIKHRQVGRHELLNPRIPAYLLA